MSNLFALIDRKLENIYIYTYVNHIRKIYSHLKTFYNKTSSLSYLCNNLNSIVSLKFDAWLNWIIMNKKNNVLFISDIGWNLETHHHPWAFPLKLLINTSGTQPAGKLMRVFILLATHPNINMFHKYVLRIKWTLRPFPQISTVTSHSKPHTRN